MTMYENNNHQNSPLWRIIWLYFGQSWVSICYDFQLDFSPYLVQEIDLDPHFLQMIRVNNDPDNTFLG